MSILIIVKDYKMHMRKAYSKVSTLTLATSGSNIKTLFRHKLDLK